ncbi:MAG TPA: P-II family nitrogen regulator [bacterium]|nr:P-II family nitrogen regulator [bacterium]
MKEIKAIIQPYMLDSVCDALEEIEGIPGLTVAQIQGFGRGNEAGSDDAEKEGRWRFGHKTKVEIVVTDAMVPVVVEAIARSARTGKPGDGKIFVYEVTDVVNIRTGNRGELAI